MTASSGSVLGTAGGSGPRSRRRRVVAMVAALLVASVVPAAPAAADYSPIYGDAGDSPHLHAIYWLDFNTEARDGAGNPLDAADAVNTEGAVWTHEIGNDVELTVTMDTVDGDGGTDLTTGLMVGFGAGFVGRYGDNTRAAGLTSSTAPTHSPYRVREMTVTATHAGEPLDLDVIHSDTSSINTGAERALFRNLDGGFVRPFELLYTPGETPPAGAPDGDQHRRLFGPTASTEDWSYAIIDNDAEIGERGTLLATPMDDGEVSVGLQMRSASDLNAIHLLGVMLPLDRSAAPASYGDAAHLMDYDVVGSTGTVPDAEETFAGVGEWPTGDHFPYAHDGNDLPGAEYSNLLYLGSEPPEPDAAPHTEVGDTEATVEQLIGGPDLPVLVPQSDFNPDGTYELTIQYVNETGADATIAGWIDLDDDGAFGSGERAEVPAPAGDGVQTVTLTWDNVPGPWTASAEHWMRLRIASDPGDVADPAGFAYDGEVEDHVLTTPAPVSLAMILTTNVPPGQLTAGDIIDYEIEVINSSEVTLLDVSVNAQLVPDLTPTVVPELAFMEAAVFTGTMTLTQEQIDQSKTASAAGLLIVQFQAIATFNDVTRPLVTNSYVIPIEAADPQLTVAKTADVPDGPLVAGDVIGYEIEVTNTGGVTVFDVSVDDQLVPDLTPAQIPELAPTEEAVFTGSLTLTQQLIDQAHAADGELTNTATATGTFDGEDVVGEDTITSAIEVLVLPPPDEPGCVDGPSPAEAFVCQVYLDLLRRPAEPGGLAHWAGLVDAGTSPVDLALEIAGSVEFNRLVVHDAYVQLLGRAPDTNGLAHFVDALDAGVTVEQLLSTLAASPEYLAATGGSAEQWLTAIYHDLLGRAPDPAGMAFFSVALQAGVPPVVVALEVVTSDEARINVVTTMYETMLVRAVDPDGLAFWVGVLYAGATRQQLVAAIAGSAEYQDLARARHN